MPPAAPLDAVADLLRTQDGVVPRGQLLAAYLTQARIETLLRRRALVVVHPGVYLTHTGRPTWSQRSWAATFYAGRSALHRESALHRPGKDPTPSGPITVAVDWARRVAPQDGIRIHRVRGLESKVHWNLSPPRVRLEVAAVELAHRAPDELAAISALAAVVHGEGGTEYRDAVHDRHDLTAELDGRLHDTTEARDTDAARDLDDLANGKSTPRLRYR